MWIDRIVELVPRERMVTIKHVTMAEEHLHAHFAAAPGLAALPVMPASLIIEGMAQTAGILVGHAHAFTEKAVLAKVSLAQLDEEAFPGDTLRYTARVQQMDRVGAAVAGTVEKIALSGEARVIGAVDLMFSYIDQNMAGTEFPAHNFVYGESFKTLLAMSGISC